MRIQLLVITLVCASPLLVKAAVPLPPPADAARDSAALRWEEGAELTRWLGTARFDVMAPSRVRTYLKADWITGLSRGFSSEGRERHDARWSASAQRNFSSRYGLWGAASGQHYVDRPRNSSQRFAQENRSQLVRAGLGPAIRWNRALKSSHSIGLVADSREQQTQSGLGTWNQGEFDFTASPQVHHEAEVKLHYESPGDRDGSDTGLLYRLKQDYGAAANHADVSMGWIRREVLLTPEIPPQVREERLLRISDNLDYEIAEGAMLRGRGNLRYQDTRLDDRRGGSSRLEELESGLNTELLLSHGQHTGSISVGVQNATQTVRGEILSGQKTELAVKGGTKLNRTTLRGRAAFSKYTLDTRSEQNFDDRDELQWRFDIGVGSPITPNLRAEAQALIDLNHLVYIFGKNSANNRWTRLILLSTRLVHRPNSAVVHVPDFRISANYQAYDFELNPRQVRSTVFRKVAIGDSVGWQFLDKWALGFRGDISREELGRLFWEPFEAERSDQTDVVSTSFHVIRTLTATSSAGLGAAYSRRKGDRFEAKGSPRRVLDIESWGPIARLQWLTESWFVQSSGQWVLQSELGRGHRDFISGSLTAGRTW